MSLTVFYEPTDMLIAGKPFELNPEQYRQIKFMTPNVHELRKIAQTLKPSLSIASTVAATHDDDSNIVNEKFLNEVAELCDKLHDIENIIVTAGCHGIFIQRFFNSESTFFTNDFKYIDCEESGGGGVRKKSLRHYPSMTIERDVKSSSGAGDSFCAGFITGMLNHKSEAICVSIGLEAAIVSLRSVNAVPERFFTKNHACWSTPAKFNIVKR